MTSLLIGGSGLLIFILLSVILTKVLERRDRR